ncbi:MAG: ATP-binding cassette domain-containing protein [Zavarzinella sp.]
MPIIEANELCKSYRVYQKKSGLRGASTGLFRREYKVVQAVKRVSFQIEPGEMVAFLGPNGAGKTTTLKMLSGLIFPNSGTAKVLGYTPWDRPDAFRRKFALVMGQKNQLWWDLPAADSFDLHRAIYSIDPTQFQQTLDDLIELFQVKDHIRQPVRELSLGERMKMELIASLLHQPQLLLLDEPTIGLDVVAQVTIQKCLRELNQAKGVTMLLTSHYMKDVEALCKRVMIINHGQLVYDGSLADITNLFGEFKLLTLHLAEVVSADQFLSYGEVVRHDGPVIELRVARTELPTVLQKILMSFSVVDMNVEDPPLEEVIAKVFAQGVEDSDPDPDKN